MTAFPDRALRHKHPGTELRRIKNRYYLYAITSKWNPDKKRSQKITVKMLGCIDEHGFRPTGERPVSPVRLAKGPDYTKIVVKEYGVSFLFDQYVPDLVAGLQKFYPNTWQMLIGVAYCRLLSQAPISHMPMIHAQSYLSESYIGPLMNERNIGLLLRDVGRDRDTASLFMRSFIDKDQHLLFDLTHIPSKSEVMGMSQAGHNAEHNYDGQINMLYLFSLKRQEPVFYRLVPGNIRDVSALALTIAESGAKDATLIADKGFYSAANAKSLQKTGLRFIMPIKRDSKLIEAHRLAEATIKAAGNYLTFEGRVVWHCSYTLAQEGQTLFLFVDNALKAKEEQDYLARVQEKKTKYTLQNFHKKRPFFGLIALITNEVRPKASETFYAYKNRNQIEMMFDSLKNVLDADKTYMQNEETLNGWMFANHLALVIYYRLYQCLQRKESLGKNSVHSLVQQLSFVKKVKIDGKWFNAESTKKSAELFRHLEIPIP